jgi:amidase
MRFPEYDGLDALSLADLVARGQVTPGELLEAALERADALGAIGAIPLRFDDEARRRAAGPLPAGPLSGVPFLLKDLGAAWVGLPLESSSRLLRGHRSSGDSEVGRRLRGAGLVPFGRTTSSELGILGVAEPLSHGPARNPWDLSRTPGGSSGGSGAAVAARVVPAAHGGDGGGSLRIPASHCGLVGLKPTRGRTSSAPAAEGWLGYVQEHVVTRSVRDCAAFLDVLAGPAPGDGACALPPPPSPFLAGLARPPGRLRVAFTDRPLYGTRIDPACQRAVREAAALLASLGHEVVEEAPPFEREAMVRAYLAVVGAGVAADLARLAAEAGRPLDGAALEASTKAMVLVGRHLPAAAVAEALETAQRARRLLAPWFARHDLCLTATVARPPVRIGELDLSALERAGVELLWRLPVRGAVERLVAAAAEGSLAATPNTQLWNQTGHPAVSLPLAASDEGLPIGVQLAARHGEEALLLGVAAQLEEARPWAGRLPPLLRGGP